MELAYLYVSTIYFYSCNLVAILYAQMLLTHDTYFQLSNSMHKIILYMRVSVLRCCAIFPVK